MKKIQKITNNYKGGGSKSALCNLCNLWDTPYKVRHDRTGHTEYVGLRRIRLLPPPEPNPNDIPDSSLAN